MSLRWGIVTAGNISHDFVNAFNSYPDKGDAVIVAVAARDETRANAFAKLHNIPQVIDSYQTMAVSDAIDVVYIGALIPHHYDLVKLFLENGKHVLCEKSLCMNFKQAQSLINLSKKNNVFLMEAIWSRFAPAYIALENKIQSGKLGDVKFVEVDFGVKLDLDRIQCFRDKLGQKSLGGGQLLEYGIYTLQFAQFVFKDEPKKVTAVYDLNDSALINTVVLEYEGGRRAVLNIHGELTMWNKATVVGTQGRATLEEPFHFATDLICDSGVKKTFSLHTSELPFNFKNSAGLVYQALEVARCIKEGLIESPRMSHEDSLILAKLEDTIRQQIGIHFEEDDKEYP